MASDELARTESRAWTAGLAIGAALVALAGAAIGVRQRLQAARPIGELVAATLPGTARVSGSPGLLLVLQPTDCRANLGVVRLLNSLRLVSRSHRAAPRGVAAIVVNAPAAARERSDLLLVSGIEFPIAYVGPNHNGLLQRLRALGWTSTPLLIGLDSQGRVAFVTRASQMDSTRIAPLLGLIAGPA